MKAFEKVAFPIGVLFAFVYGLVGPWLQPNDAYAEISALLGNNVFVIAAVAATCSALSATTMYISVRVTSSQPAIMRLFLKCFVFMLPALALGLLTSMLLAAVGICKIAQPVAFLAISAATWLCGGVAGIAALRVWQRQLRPAHVADKPRKHYSTGVQKSPMTSSERIVYPVGIAFAFAYGLVWPLLLPRDVYSKISALLGNNGLVIAIVALLCAAVSAMVGCLMGCAAHGQPTMRRLIVKCFVLMMPAVGSGVIASMLLVAAGVCRTAQPLGFLAVSAAMWLCGGLAGIAAMRSFWKSQRSES